MPVDATRRTGSLAAIGSRPAIPRRGRRPRRPACGACGSRGARKDGAGDAPPVASAVGLESADADTGRRAWRRAVSRIARRQVRCGSSCSADELERVSNVVDAERELVHASARFALPLDRPPAGEGGELSKKGRDIARALEHEAPGARGGTRRGTRAAAGGRQTWGEAVARVHPLLRERRPAADAEVCADADRVGPAKTGTRHARYKLSCGAPHAARPAPPRGRARPSRRAARRAARRRRAARAERRRQRRHRLGATDPRPRRRLVRRRDVGGAGGAAARRRASARRTPTPPAPACRVGAHRHVAAERRPAARRPRSRAPRIFGRPSAKRATPPDRRPRPSRARDARSARAPALREPAAACCRRAVAPAARGGGRRLPRARANIG